MTAKEILTKIEDLIGRAKSAVFATISDKGEPHMRWMSPVLLPEREGVIYAVSSGNFGKVSDVNKNPAAAWMFQTATLNEVVNVSVHVHVVDNPSIKKEVMEKMGRRLHVFWKLKGNDTDFIVLETIIKEAVYFDPMKGKKTFVSFEGGKNGGK
ncbi:MAG: pyridoxamine 5'-phosphate oxidase family protein [Spirochaetales bacterium]|nr:pyridoxamine 5'-phosphate oxidase family protein [Spirochaetales bacterium]